MPVPRAQEIVDLAAAERARFVEWVRRVPAEKWPNTAADGTWQARDYVAHLASIDPLLTAAFRAYQSTGSIASATEGGLPFSIDDWNEGKILERRARSIEELLEEMEKCRVDLNAALADFTDEQLDRTFHFGGDAKRSPRDLPIYTFLRGWAMHDRWHMEDARRAAEREAEQPFGDAAFQAMRQQQTSHLA